MPTYEYRCTDGHTFEVFQSMSEDPLTECGVCGKPIERVLFAPAVHFKGSGFYTTDYARKGAKTDAEGAKDSSSNNGDSKSSDSKFSDSKSADSKSDSKPKTEKTKSSSD